MKDSGTILVRDITETDISCGIGLQFYPKACAIFMGRFNLSRILFKTPIQNIGALRVKEKLGIRCIGEEEIGFGRIKEGTRAKVFELTSAELESMTPF